MRKLHNTSHVLNRRRLLASVVATASLAVAGMAQAQTAWQPSGTVRLVVPYAAGGAADLVARVLASALGDHWHQTVIVENLPGATGTIGTTHVYKAEPDGMTLLLAVPDVVSIYPNLAETRYDPKKFIPVANIGVSAFVLLARPTLSANNIQEFISLAREQPLNFGNAGMGGSVHLMNLALGMAADIPEMTHVSFGGMAPAIQAVMGDHVDTYFSSVGGTPQYQSHMKFLGISSAQRSPLLPDVPTFTEQGVPLVQDLWFGVLAPPETPASITAELSKTINEITSTTTYQAKVGELALTVPTMTQEEFAQYYEDDNRKWGDVIRAGNVKLE